jgi:hypothetical protein
MRPAADLFQSRTLRTIKLTHYPTPSIGCTVACFPRWLTGRPHEKTPGIARGFDLVARSARDQYFAITGPPKR